MKLKKCRVCNSEFSPYRSTQVVCSAKCAYEHTQNSKAAKVRKQWAKEKREFLKKDKKFQESKAQAAFNAFIRARDAHLPCISCQRHHKGQYHAGHYKTRGAFPELAMNEDNCHKQCSVCNNHLSGNVAEYRKNLIEKIGIERVEALESHRERPKLTADDFAQIAAHYKKQLKRIQGRK